MERSQEQQQRQQFIPIQGPQSPVISVTIDCLVSKWAATQARYRVVPVIITSFVGDRTAYVSTTTIKQEKKRKFQHSVISILCAGYCIAGSPRIMSCCTCIFVHSYWQALVCPGKPTIHFCMTQVSAFKELTSHGTAYKTSAHSCLDFRADYRTVVQARRWTTTCDRSRQYRRLHRVCVVCYRKCSRRSR